MQPEVLQVPGEVYRRCTVPMHTEVGGERQPWQTSPMQLPALQPLAQVMSTCVYSQRPMAQVPGDWKAVRVLPLQVAPGGAVQPVHVAPAVPQRDSLWPEGRTHWPRVLQQPSGQEAASQTHTPPEHRWPAAQARPEPQAHSPLVSQRSAVGPQLAHACPRAPQAFRSGVWQVFPAQQPVVQDWAQPLQVPDRQDSPAGQRVQAWPRAPQAEASVPVTQVSPSQQPVGHDSALQATDASDAPPAVPPPPPSTSAPPPAAEPPAAPPPVATPHTVRHVASLQSVVPAGHPACSSGLKADSFEASTHTHDVTVAAASTSRRNPRRIEG